MKPPAYGITTDKFAKYGNKRNPHWIGIKNIAARKALARVLE